MTESDKGSTTRVAKVQLDDVCCKYANNNMIFLVGSICRTYRCHIVEARNQDVECLGNGNHEELICYNRVWL